MRLTSCICSLMLVCSATGGEAFGQADAPKTCPFNIVGTWRSEATATDPIFFRFAHDGTATLLSRSNDIPNEDFEVVAAVKYKLDKPAAPKSLDIIAARGNKVFGMGTSTLTITEYGDESFTTSNPLKQAGPTRWVRAKTGRYFLTFAARGGPPQVGGPAFAMWTKLDGRKTEVETLGLDLVADGAGEMVPVLGPIPEELHKQFMNESGKDSDVMIRLELTEAEYERTHRVFRTWAKRVQGKTLLYDDDYLNATEFLRRTAESLNQCGEKVKLHKLTWSQGGEAFTKHNLPQHPLEYIRIMREKNKELHVGDKKFPADWRPTP
jgi:hypothetical protein